MLGFLAILKTPFRGERSVSMETPFDLISQQAGDDDGQPRTNPLEGSWFDLHVRRSCGPRCTPRCYDHRGVLAQLPSQYRIPSAPFIRWCLSKTPSRHLSLPWKPAHKSGMKITGDNPYHTDWVVGAGVSLAMVYRDHALSKAADRVRLEVQQEICGFKAAVLCGNARTSYLEVVHPEPDQELSSSVIAVCPYASPEYYIPAVTAAATIVEVGGPLSHLACVGRSEGVSVLQVDGARALYPEGTRVRVDALRGLVEVDFLYDFRRPV